MSEHKRRAEIRKEANDPINFTCGGCMKVQPFKEGYVCDDCEARKNPPIEEEVI